MTTMSQLADIYEYILSHNIVLKIVNSSYEFHDEAHLPTFTSLLNPQLAEEVKEAGLISDVNGLTSSGYSFHSPKLALLKCLIETLERFCLFTYLEETIYIKPYTSLQQNALSPTQYRSDASLKNHEFGWIPGYDVVNEKKMLIPAQLAYLNYNLNQNNQEPVLSQRISTGAAGGFGKDETLLRGIYEVVERDSIMTSYLNKVLLQRVNYLSITNKHILDILTYLKKYWLKVHIFYIRNDLQIPTFMTILEDKTSFGPAIAVGTKTNLNIESALLGSIEEALFTRHSMRKIMYKHMPNLPLIQNDNITSIEGRALFWLQPDSKKFLSFLLESDCTIGVNQIPQSFKGRDSESELVEVISRLKSNKYSVYYADIALPQIKRELGLHIFKVLIPEFQPLYLNEQEKEYMIQRLQINAELYKRTNIAINPIPHPFL